MNKSHSQNRGTLLKKFEKLLDIIDTLRQKCPWDRVQTLQSLRELTLEESYELSDAILANQPKDIVEELGDLLLHLLFYCKILSETDPHDDIETVIEQLSEKLVRRHPHIYGTEKIERVEEVSKNWEKIKQKEGKPSILSGVPKSAPNLKKAAIIQKKVAAIGFDFDSEAQAWHKVEEELNELKSETTQDKRQRELGDVLFSLVNWGRKTGLDSDHALAMTIEKFTKRFHFIEHKTQEKGNSLSESSLEDMENLWEQSKNEEG